MSGEQMHQCEFCQQQFKREDHLTRHKLSHGKAKFRCSFAGCAMTFHRKDVLRRHEKVHEPNSSVKRRRPRRGVEPKPFVARPSGMAVGGGGSGSDDGDDDVDDVDATENRPSESGLTTSLSEKNAHDGLTGLPAEALAFCSLHFAQSCLLRFPFIHHHSLDRSDMVPEQLLAMAILGGYAIPQYADAVPLFFARAKEIVEWRRGATAGVREGETHDDRSIRVDAKKELSMFQARVLLIEYTTWSPQATNRTWARQQACQLASEVVPKLVQQLQTTRFEKADWLDWIYQEQCIRTLWAFYCTTQKAKIPSPCMLSTLHVLRALRLPGLSAAFEAQTELDWKRALAIDLDAETEAMNDFQLAFYTIMSNSTNENHLHGVRSLGRHVLLSALLEQYVNALALPTNFDSYEAYRNTTLTQFKRRSEFWQVLHTCERAWLTDPAVLFATNRIADLQNMLFMSYLKVLMFGGREEHAELRGNFLVAVNMSCEVFYGMVRNGILEVATKACWLTDGASRHFVTEFGLVMLAWSRGLQSSTDFTLLKAGDRALYDRCAQALREFYQQFTDTYTLLTITEIPLMERQIYDAWSIILSDKDWARYLRPSVSRAVSPPYPP